MDKTSLRRLLHEKISSVRNDSDAICEKVFRFLSTRPDLKTIATFAALPGEVDLSSLVGKIQRRWVFPKVRGERLEFRLVTDPTTGLLPGYHGILEPDDDLPLVDPEKIDAFLCPGLGFDPHGGRLGRGKGFYDRLLAQARPDAEKIGVCFPCQIVDRLETEPHDIRMDRVIHG